LQKKFLNPEGLYVYRTNNDEIVATPEESNIRINIVYENSCSNPICGKHRKPLFADNKYAAEYWNHKQEWI
jgi:predicted nucleic acid binding AN1-type Zn finger protein